MITYSAERMPNREYFVKQYVDGSPTMTLLLPEEQALGLAMAILDSQKTPGQRHFGFHRNSESRPLVNTPGNLSSAVDDVLL